MEQDFTIATQIEKETQMNAKLVAEAESLRRTAVRMQRVGLIVDRSTLSPTARRAYFALQCQGAQVATEADDSQTKIGFAYPNAR